MSTAGGVINPHCEVEWPSLGAGAGGGGKEEEKQHDGIDLNRSAGSSDWELLDVSGSDENLELQREGHPPTEKEESQRQKVQIVKVNPKILRHSASSPDLRRFHHELDEIAERSVEGDQREDELFDDDDLDGIGCEYSLVDNPASVISLSSTNATTTTTSGPWGGAGGITFRDALASKPAHENSNILGQKPADQQPQQVQQQGKPPRSRPRIQPKFVVKSIKRCARSTGDLQAMGRLHDEQQQAEGFSGGRGGGGGGGGFGNGDAGAEDVMGDTDAMEFYHRKAAGAKGRENGLKLRPDEMKRKEITIHKKDMQRQAQQQQQQARQRQQGQTQGKGQQKSKQQSKK